MHGGKSLWRFLGDDEKDEVRCSVQICAGTVDGFSQKLDIGNDFCNSVPDSDLNSTRRTISWNVVNICNTVNRSFNTISDPGGRPMHDHNWSWPNQRILFVLHVRITDHHPGISFVCRNLEDLRGTHLQTVFCHFLGKENFSNCKMYGVDDAPVRHRPS